MTTTPRSDSQLRFLGGIASILSLLGVCLFFLGWIYRWAYYSYYQLEVTRLDLNPQSFLIVPLQIFLGSPLNVLKTFVIFLGLAVVINLSLWLLRQFNIMGQNLIQKVGFFRRWQHRFDRVPQQNQDSMRLATNLVDEGVIVFWVLLLLFWFARHQGTLDAQRDAVNATSTLPVITLLTTKSSFVLGSSAVIINDELPPDPVLTNNEVIVGEVQLARIVRLEAINDLADGNSRVWRLLTERNGSIYIFPTISAEKAKIERPIVVAFPGGPRDQLLILASDVPKQEPSASLK